MKLTRKRAIEMALRNWNTPGAESGPDEVARIAIDLGIVLGLQMAAKMCPSRWNSYGDAIGEIINRTAVSRLKKLEKSK